MGEAVRKPTDIEPDDIRNIPTFRAAYSDRTALLMARLAHRAYYNFENSDGTAAEFRDGFNRLGLVECETMFDKGTSTAGFVVAGEEIIVVVFRGTQHVLNWWTNMNVAWTPLKGGVRVHTGFAMAYKTVRDPLFAAVERLLVAKQRPVYITGHSLGGALALMATSELANHPDADVRDSIAACYTFGCPKAGDRSFDQYVKVPLYRVTNGVDLVPAVPPVFSGYKHVGDTRYFSQKGASPLRRAPNLFRKLWLTSLGLLQFLRTRKIVNIQDHSMEVYIDKLDAWARAVSEETQKRRAETANA
jgi:triacylglycerol lipase